MKVTILAAALGMAMLGGAPSSTVHAFMAPRSPLTTSTATLRSRSTTLPTEPQQYGSSNLGFGGLLVGKRTGTHATTLSATQLFSAVDGSRLTTFLLETVISNGVPALFAILVLGFAANVFRPKRDYSKETIESTPVAELYTDLYGEPSSSKSRPGFGNFFNPRQPQKLLINTGIPSQQYIKVEKRNTKLDSYNYSMTAATQSKALASSIARSRNFDAALLRGLSSSDELTDNQKASLLDVEKEFLKRATPLQGQVSALQLKLTKDAIDDEMNALGISPKELDPDLTSDMNVTQTAKATKKKDNLMFPMPFRGKNSKVFKEINSLQENLLRLELNFVQDVISILPERSRGIKAALLGNVGAGGALLTQLQERPLSTILKDMESSTTGSKNVFVTQFPGDATASQVQDLREEVTAIVRNAQPGDEAVVVLQTGGGTVTGYGLAAAQLQRFKGKGLKLTICVEQVAASGGYMMACIADRIVASPFAVLGSIGVISDIPNIYERLKQEGIAFQTITAGKYKRTITPTKKVTQEDLAKSKEDIEDVLKLFKSFVAQNRPSLDIDKVATGETWFGTDALERNLCDEIKTVDDVITEYVDEGFNVYDVKYEPPPEQPEFSRLLPIGVSASGGGIAAKAVRWLARTVVSEIQSELDDIVSTAQRPDRKYMMKDDTADRTRMD